LPISQSRYQNAETNIKAGIRIMTRSNFIATHSTASFRLRADLKDTMGRKNEK